jgi:hypothetical protein
MEKFEAKKGKGCGQKKMTRRLPHNLLVTGQVCEHFFLNDDMDKIVTM